MTNRFWVYVNEPNDKAFVHISDCSHCNDGKGRTTDKLPHNGQWHGAYAKDRAISVRVPRTRKQSAGVDFAPDGWVWTGPTYDGNGLMARRATKKKKIKVETLTHEESTRKNIPTAELETVMSEEDETPIRMAYERRNRDLDPQLVWRGKDKQDWSDLVAQALVSGRDGCGNSATKKGGRSVQKMTTRS